MQGTNIKKNVEFCTINIKNVVKLIGGKSVFIRLMHGGCITNIIILLFIICQAVKIVF